MVVVVVVVVVVIFHRCCHLVVYNRSCSVPPTVPVHFKVQER